jgi:hypothetical protein
MNDAQRMRNTVILITGEGMGRGDLELQRVLIGKYLSLLAESDLLPNSICLYTDGVKLAITGFARARPAACIRAARRTPDLVQHLPYLLQPDGPGAGRHHRWNDRYSDGSSTGRPGNHPLNKKSGYGTPGVSIPGQIQISRIGLAVSDDHRAGHHRRRRHPDDDHRRRHRHRRIHRRRRSHHRHRRRHNHHRRHRDDHRRRLLHVGGLR